MKNLGTAKDRLRAKAKKAEEQRSSAVPASVKPAAQGMSAQRRLLGKAADIEYNRQLSAAREQARREAEVKFAEDVLDFQQDKVLSGGIQPINTMNYREHQKAVEALGKSGSFGGKNPGEVRTGFQGERLSGGYDPMKAAGAAVQQGLAQFAQTGSGLLAGIEDVAFMPFELMAGQKIGEASQGGLMNRWHDSIVGYEQAVREDNRKNLEAGGKAAQIMDEVGTATIAALPQAVAAMMTGGATLPAQSTAGLNTIAQSAMSPGVVNTVNQAVRRMARDPQYWMSFAQTVGPSYQQAVAEMREKNGGELTVMDMTKATLYALGNGLAGAAVEVGGGIQTLPEELRHGGSAWRALVDAAVDEGKEEPIQGVIERGLQSLFGKGNPLFSVTDPEAVLNPVTAGKEAALGSAVGLLLGGGQTMVQKGVEALAGGRRADVPPAGEIDLAGRETVSGQEKTAPVEAVTAPELDRAVDGAESNPLSAALSGGNRVDRRELTREQVAAWRNSPDVWQDAGGKVYQMDPGDHISQRTAEGVASRSVNAFSFDHPELQRHMKQAAQELLKDAGLSLDTGRSMRTERTMQGKKTIQSILESPALRSAMDMGLSRGQIIKAAEDLIADHGQENYAAAKRLELVLDEMLTDGFTTVEGEYFPPNQAYIDAKASIPGYQAAEAEDLPLYDPEYQALSDAREKALQSAYEAGKSNVPREKVELLDEAQERAYTAGRQAAILAEAGPGVVRDEYTASLDRKTVEELDTVAKALGVKVQFVDSVAGGQANAQIKDGAILMERGNPNPVRFLFGHEIAHHLQEIAPAEYRRLREAAVAAVGDIENAVFARQAEYAEHEVELSYGEAVDELTADYVGRMMEDSGYLEEFIQRHRQDRTLLERLRDAFRELGRKLTGRYRTLAGQVEKRLTAAMEAGVKATAEKTAADGGDGRFSLRKAGGKNVVWIESSSLSNKELNNHKAVAAFIARHIGEVYTIIESGQKVYIGEDLPGEYTQSKYTSYLRQTDHAAARAKNKAVDGLGELIETATNRRWERTRHTQSKDAKYGMYRYDSTFAFPVKDAGGAARRVRAYDVELVIRNASDGKKYLYDIVSIKENTSAQIDLTAKEAGSAAHKAATGGSVSVDSVSQNESGRKGETEDSAVEKTAAGEGDGKFSIKTTANGLKYVQADREVLTGDDPKKWGKQIEDFINKKIRHGEDVMFITDDGHILALTGRSAYKLSDRHRGKIKKEARELLSDDEYFLKGSAAGHIDELIQVGRFSKYQEDVDGLHNNDIGEDGFNYFTAYFKDGGEEDKYYRIPFSSALNGDGETVYSIGTIKKRKFPPRSGSSGKNRRSNGTKESSRQENSTGGGESQEKTAMRYAFEKAMAERDGKKDNGVDSAKFSLKLSGAVARETERIIREGRENKLSDSEIQEQIQSAVHTIYQGMVRDYGAMKPGEQPFREAQVPRRTEKDKKVSQTVRTILEARATPEEALPDIEKLTADGVFSYSPYSDKQAVADAEAEIGKQGWNKSVRTWFDQVRRGEVSKALTTQGWVLYNNAANRGDVELAMDILDAMVKHQRSAAQAVQATRILKKLSPETQLYGVQRSVDGLQEDLKARYGKKAPGLKIDRKLAEEYLQARTQGERDAILADIYRDIGRQMPSKFLDKWNAWRYLAMLGNPRTHVRNIVGNLGFAPVVSAKNMTATAIEAMVGRISGGGLQRTKAIPGGKLLKAAWEDFANVKDMVMEGGKYDDRAAANQHIREGQRVFKNKALEAARRGNSAALEVEDMIFSKGHYAAALASYCKANGITAEQIAAGKGLDKAREYAAREAQKATYRDANAFSQFVSSVGRLGSKDSSYARGAAKLVEGVLPFRKTPANILVRGLEYSPLGLLNGIKEAMVDVRAGRKTGAEAIDSISAGMVGTGLLGLGIYLASQGWVRGSGAGDDKEKEQDKLMGHQDYALELPDGKSVTLDWLAPEALPFFMGVNLWEATRGDFANAKLVDYLGAVSQVTEPLLEMSMLQSLNDMFSQVGNTLNAGVKGLPAAMSSAATSYLTQGLPTLLGQMERSGEDVRMTTYVGKNDFLTDDIQRALGKASARIPGWDFHQIPYIDAWGRQESTGDLMKRTTGNFLNPAYLSDIQESHMERELLRLYRSTGESVFPRRVDKVLRYDNQEKYLTAEEYVKYATKTGQTAREVMERLVDSPAYQKMDDGKRAEAVIKVYQYADAVGKESVSSYKAKGTTAKIIEANKKLQIKPEHYIALYLEVKDVSSLKDKNGESIPNSPGLLIMDILFRDKSLTAKQREGLYEMFDVGKTIRHYSPALVKNKLAEMRRKAG